MNNQWIPEGVGYLTFIDDKEKLVEILVTIPKELGTEVEVRYNMRPSVSNIKMARKIPCGNSILVDMEVKPDVKDVIPGKCPWIMSDIKVNDKNVIIRHKGIGGGRESVMGMMQSEGVESYDIHRIEECIDVSLISTRYERLVVGLDSTDSKFEGCTLYLAHNIALQLQKKFPQQIKYIYTQGALLNIRVQNKTQNNSTSTVIFAVKQGMLDDVIKEFYNLAIKYSISDSAFMTVFRGLQIPEEIHQFALRAKKEILTIDEAKDLLEKYKIENYSLTGEAGIIGALAAIGFTNDMENATRVAY